MRYKFIFNGFKLGIVLQAAIGPVALLIFQTSVQGGLVSGIAAAMGVAVVDAIYVAAAILGVGMMIERCGRAKMLFGILGSAAVAFFGVSIIMGALGSNAVLRFAVSETPSAAFLQAFILAFSSPLTIIFWAGVFASRLEDGEMKGLDIWLFGAGAVVSTVVCMPLIAAAGALLSSFIPRAVIMALNILVGCALIGFSLRPVINKVREKL
ncbi:MAG: LysE family transporter [Synergistes sp.]|nr:LysE family transporter [Synergistes sp.]